MCNRLNWPKLKTKNRDYKTLPVQLYKHIYISYYIQFEEKEGKKRVKYRAGGKGRTVGKGTETTRKVTTPKRQIYTHQVKIQGEKQELH